MKSSPEHSKARLLLPKNHKEFCQTAVFLCCLKFAGFKPGVVRRYLDRLQVTRLQTPADCAWAQELPGCAGRHGPTGKHALQGCSPHSQRMMGC